MKEYKIQMKLTGKWMTAHYPNNMNNRIFQDTNSAEQFISNCRESWEYYTTKLDLNMTPPEEYRILVRDVTEWKEA